MTISIKTKKGGVRMNKKYETPNVEVINIETIDVIATSGITGGEGTGNVGGGGNLED